MSASFAISLYNFIQYASVIAGILTLLLVSLVTILGLISQISSLVGYQTVVIILASVNFILGTMWVILLPIIIYPDGDTVYLLGHHYPLWMTKAILTLLNFFYRISVELLAVSIVYRTIVVLRPHWQRRAGIFMILISIPAPIYAIFDQKFDLRLEPMCNFACFNENDPKAVYLHDNVTTTDVTEVIDDIIYVIVIFAGVPCIVILNKWFKKRNFSDKTLKMQKRLTFALGIMIAIHLITFITNILFVVGMIVGISTGIKLSPALMMFLTIVANWVMPLKAWIIFLSVKNLLKMPKIFQKFQPNKIKTSSTQVFQSRNHV